MFFWGKLEFASTWDVFWYYLIITVETGLCFRNAMCGKVQCTNVDLYNHPAGAQISIETVQDFNCINADFNLGTDVLDPAYVNPGSPCAKGKVSL